MKTCAKCGKPKQEKFFSWRSKARGTRSSYCKECQRAYTKADYERNTDYYRDKTKRRREEVCAWLKEIKSNTPCADCGQTFHYAVMDFDHVLGRKKECVNKMSRAGSKRQLEKEIEKCELVCANCHRLRTFRRRE